jgi:hypothetical protein
MDTMSKNTSYSDSSFYSPVCMIYSQLSLKEIEDVFRQYGDNGTQHGPLRVVRSKKEDGTWQDTNRTIVLVTEKLFNSLIEDGLDKPVKTSGRSALDFRIVPYQVRDSNLPREGLKKDLFIRLPKGHSLDIGEVMAIISAKLAPLVTFGVISANQYTIKIPLRNKDRSTGIVTSACFIAFTDDVLPEQAALVKAVIDDTFWGEQKDSLLSKETFHCYWARDQKEMAPVANKFVKRSKSAPAVDTATVGLDKDGKKAFYKADVVKRVPLTTTQS